MIKFNQFVICDSVNIVINEQILGTLATYNGKG